MSTDERRDTGRPSTYSQDLADTLCEMIAAGQNLTGICQQEGMPSKTTAYRWLTQNEEFRQQYGTACQMRAEHLADEILDIADNAAPEDTQRARLMVDTRKWLMAKMAPRKFGDKISTEHSGPDGGDIPLKVTTDVDRARALAAMIAKTRANAPTAG